MPLLDQSTWLLYYKNRNTRDTNAYLTDVLEVSQTERMAAHLMTMDQIKVLFIEPKPSQREKKKIIDKKKLKQKKIANTQNLGASKYTNEQCPFPITK